MLLKDHMSGSGAHLFRWRGYLLLGFVPFMIAALFQGERVEIMLGDRIGDGFEWFCILMVAAGQAIRIGTVGFVPHGTSGRNTKAQIAEVLNTSGVYSIVRNPLYFGNCLIYLGLALFTQNVLLALVMALVLALYYERIIAAEEAFLEQKFAQPYRDWAARTPAFFPRLTGWEPPAMPFSLRSVIRREHASIFGALAALYLIEIGLHYLSAEPESFDIGWNVIMVVAVVLELAARGAKHRTNALAVAGR